MAKTMKGALLKLVVNIAASVYLSGCVSNNSRINGSGNSLSQSGNIGGGTSSSTSGRVNSPDDLSRRSTVRMNQTTNNVNATSNYREGDRYEDNRVQTIQDNRR